MYFIEIHPDNWQWMNNDEDVKIVQLETIGWKYTSVAKEVFSTAETTVNQIVKVRNKSNLDPVKWKYLHVLFETLFHT